MTTQAISITRESKGGSYFDWKSWLFWLIMAVWSVPLLWLMSMSVRYNEDILSVFEIIPSRISFRGYIEFFTEPLWYGALINSLSYTTMNMVLSVAVALPAAYAFSRFTFSGDKHLFFWLLTNRMAPAAVFLLPFFQMYQALGLFDTTYAVANNPNAWYI